MRNAKEDPSLTEVKAVLRKLQRLDLPDSGQSAPEAPSTGNIATPGGAARPGAGGMSVFDKKRAAIETKAPAAKTNPVALYGGAGVGGLVIVAGALFGTGAVHFGSTPEPQKPVVTQPVTIDERAVLSDARHLLAEGDTQQARQRLLAGTPDRHADLAFTLAQSYDPNYLKSLPKTNGQPDKAEAEKWYRRWYDLALKSGLEMDTERLNRIINAMR